MKSKTLVGTVAALALGLTGAAFAEGDTAKKGESGTQGSQTGQSGSQSGATGSQSGTSGTQSGATGSESGTGVSKGATSGKTGASGQSAMGKASDIPSIKLTTLDESQVTDLQTRLQELGFYKGEIDGKVGRQTRAALSQWFRQQMNLVNQGRVSEAALSGLGFSDTDIERVRGVDEESGTGTGTGTGSKSKSGSGTSSEGGTGTQGSSGSGTSGSGTSGSGTQGGSDKSGTY